MLARLRTLAAFSVAAVACSTVPPSPVGNPAYPVASRARVQSSCPLVQPAPQFRAAAPSSRTLALVFLKGSTDYVVRDITDVNHSFTTSSLGGLTPRSGPNLAYYAQLVSASDISYYNHNGNLMRKAFDGLPTKVANPCNLLFDFAWSPGGTKAAYVTDLSDYSAGELHLVGGGKDRAVSSMPAITPTGCVGCEDFANSRLLFSPNGGFMSFAITWAGRSYLRIWNSNGKLVMSAEGDPPNWTAGPSMSVWSGNTFFFRDKQGVQTWRNGAQSLSLPGVMWIRPKASPGGGRVVYAAKDQSGTPNVFLLDTASAQTRMLAKSRSEPAFLNSHVIWYKEERRCVPGDGYPCGYGSISTVETGKAYIYDLLNKSETESTIEAVIDVWPHPA